MAAEVMLTGADADKEGKGLPSQVLDVDYPPQVIGPASQIHGSAWAPDEGHWELYVLLNQASGIRAGTPESLRNILGERVLGLPKD